MKIHVIPMLILLSINAACAQHAVPTRATFVVRDDMDMPVVNAQIEGGFPDLSATGSRDRFVGVTDSNGMFVAEGNAVIGVDGRVTVEGHYQTIVTVSVGTNRAMNSWSLEIPVLLKRIRNPIPMYFHIVNNPYISALEGVGKYRIGQTSSFDIVTADFLSPYGAGRVADFEFIWGMTIYSKDDDGLAWNYDTLCEIRMTNGVDGICRGSPDGAEDGQIGSLFYSAYEAPKDGYTNYISFYDHVRGTKAEGNDDRHYLYYFRVRTQTNELGQVTNALYGQIHGQINGRFAYFLNPTPNDRNMEFDPKRNLFTD